MHVWPSNRSGRKAQNICCEHKIERKKHTSMALSRTTWDTVSRSWAAIPGLWRPRVNFRSVIFAGVAVSSRYRRRCRLLLFVFLVAERRAYTQQHSLFIFVVIGFALAKCYCAANRTADNTAHNCGRCLRCALEVDDVDGCRWLSSLLVCRRCYAMKTAGIVVWLGDEAHGMRDAANAL